MLLCAVAMSIKSLQNVTGVVLCHAFNDVTIDVNGKKMPNNDDVFEVLDSITRTLQYCIFCEYCIIRLSY